MKCVTGDGVEVSTGDRVWLYPADSIIGGTIEEVLVGEVVSPHKFLYPKPLVGTYGRIGARAGSTYSTKEAAEVARQKDSDE